MGTQKITFSDIWQNVYVRYAFITLACFIAVNLTAASKQYEADKEACYAPGDKLAGLKVTDTDGSTLEVLHCVPKEIGAVNNGSVVTKRENVLFTGLMSGLCSPNALREHTVQPDTKNKKWYDYIWGYYSLPCIVLAVFFALTILITKIAINTGRKEYWGGCLVLLGLWGIGIAGGMMLYPLYVMSISTALLYALALTYKKAQNSPRQKWSG